MNPKRVWMCPLITAACGLLWSSAKRIYTAWAQSESNASRTPSQPSHALLVSTERTSCPTCCADITRNAAMGYECCSMKGPSHYWHWQRGDCT